MNDSDQAYPLILRWDRIASLSIDCAQVMTGFTLGWFTLQGNPHLLSVVILGAWATSLKIIIGLLPRA